MAKPRSSVRDYVAYLGFRVAVCVFQALPPRLAGWFADTVIGIVFRFDRRHREAAIDNLRQAFPGRYGEDELHALALTTFRHFASIVLEVLLLPRKVTAVSQRRYVDATEFPRIKVVFDSGRPIIILTAHYGNWELAGHWLGLAGIRGHLVARPLDNPYLDRWLRSVRELTGHKVLSKTGDIRRMTEVLHANECLVTLGDQDAGERGLFVDFFGRPASTHKAIARMAERTGAVIIVGGMQKMGGLLEYAIRIMDVIDPEEYAGRADATTAITQRYTNAVERMIRLDPIQYFWMHRRWKHQPRVASRAAA